MTPASIFWVNVSDWPLRVLDYTLHHDFSNVNSLSKMHIQLFYKSIYLSSITRNHLENSCHWSNNTILTVLRLEDTLQLCKQGLSGILARKMRVPRCGYPGESLHLLHRGGTAGAQHSSRGCNTSLHLPFQLKHYSCVNWAALSAQCVAFPPTLPIVFGTRDLLRLLYRCTVSGCYQCVLHCRNIGV